jgi:hypothetical protein
MKLDYTFFEYRQLVVLYLRHAGPKPLGMFTPTNIIEIKQYYF